MDRVARRQVWAFALMAAAFIALGTWWYVTPVAVPDVSGMTESAARSTLSISFLRLGELKPTEAGKVGQYPRGILLDQRPAAGTMVRRWTSVRAGRVIGPEQVVVPNVVGDRLVEAGLHLAELGFDVRMRTTTGEDTFGDAQQGGRDHRVKACLPRVGTRIAAGSRVVLEIEPLEIDDGPWRRGHVREVKTTGVDQCLSCHGSSQCSACHVDQIGRTPVVTVNKAGMEKYLEDIAKAVEPSATVTLRYIGTGSYSMMMTVKSNEGGKQRFLVLSKAVMERVYAEQTDIDKLTLTWMLPADSVGWAEPILSVTLTSDKAGDIHWGRLLPGKLLTVVDDSFVAPLLP